MMEKRAKTELSLFESIGRFQVINPNAMPFFFSFTAMGF